MRPSVELVIRPWDGTAPAEEGAEDATLLLSEIIIDGENAFPVSGSFRVTLLAESGDFLSLRVENPPAELAARYSDPSDHLLGTTPDVLLLPVGSLSIREFASV